MFAAAPHSCNVLQLHVEIIYRLYLYAQLETVSVYASHLHNIGYDNGARFECWGQYHDLFMASYNFVQYLYSNPTIPIFQFKSSPSTAKETYHQEY
jgi:hypothetical protein